MAGADVFGADGNVPSFCPFVEVAVARPTGRAESELVVELAVGLRRWSAGHEEQVLEMNGLEVVPTLGRLWVSANAVGLVDNQEVVVATSTLGYLLIVGHFDFGGKAQSVTVCLN